MPTSLLIVKTGAAVPDVVRRRGDYEDLFASATGFDAARTRVVAVCRDEPLPAPGDHPAVIVTGSAAMVTDHEPWSDRTAAWLADAVRSDVHVLAVCYGHQLLALGCGGRVGPNPRGREIGTVEVEMTGEAADDPLFGPLPRRLQVQATHLESVTELPPDAVHLGRNETDPNQAFRLGDRAWGVQFHPELDADIIRSYIHSRRRALIDEGLDPDASSRDARGSDHGARLLRRFAELATGRAA